MAYENTLVAVSKSQEAIRKLILSNGGSAIGFLSQPPMEGFQAHVAIDGKKCSCPTLWRTTARPWPSTCCRS